MKRSPDERHKYTKRAHGNLIDMFRPSKRSFSNHKITKELNKNKN